MQQQINLYLPEFKLKKDSLSPLLMGQILGGVIAICVLITVWDVFTRWRLNSGLTELRDMLAEETRKTDQLDEELALRSQNPQLTARLEQGEIRLEASRQIVEFLGERQLGNIEGFSEYFKDLSRASIDGLSISEFSFTEGGANITIMGNVVDSATVPRYVNNIERGQSLLSSKHFSPRISKDNVSDQYFSFVLSTDNE